jgi:biotin transport system substrate-specific component
MTTTTDVLRTVVFPRRVAVTAALVVGFALLTAAAAQIRIGLPFTPVPVTGQTLAVLLSGAALGSVAGGASQMLYLLLGAVGLPFFAGGQGGWQVVTGATGGYLVGFVIAAAFVGHLAERRQDRNVVTAVPAFLTATAIIYAFGIPWLAYRVDSIDSLTGALELGMVPFVAGDLVKIAIAGVALPATWKLIARLRK